MENTYRLLKQYNEIGADLLRKLKSVEMKISTRIEDAKQAKAEADKYRAERDALVTEINLAASAKEVEIKTALDDLSAKMSALAVKEQEIADRERNVKGLEAAIEAKKKALEDSIAASIKLEDDLSEDKPKRGRPPKDS